MKKKAFTLIEMLIVLTVTAILIPAVFSIVIVIMRQQVRIYKVVETRRQGDYVMTFLKDRLVRSKQMFNSSTNTQLCTTANSSSGISDGNNVYFLDNDNVSYRIFAQTSSGVTNLVYASPATTTGTTINNNLVQITNFSIECGRRTSVGAPLIQITYRVQFKDAENSVAINYQTKVKLRE